MINTIKQIVQTGKQAKMKIREREELRVAKEKELEKRKNQSMMMQLVQLIAIEALEQSNKLIVSLERYLSSKRNQQTISIYHFNWVLVKQANEIKTIIGMDRLKMIKGLVIDSIWHRNSDNNRKRGQERKEYYLLLLLTDSIIYSY